MNIAITGPESSGKTYLAEYLHQQFQSSLVLEYAREYLQETSPEYHYEDFKNMAQGQWQNMCDAKLSKELTIFDTDMVVFHVWSNVKYNRVEPWLEKMVKNQPVDVYFLCYPDLKWEYDELREYPNEEERIRLFEMYVEVLDMFNCSYQIVKGNEQERVEFCLSEVRKMLENES